jgi:tetratricopeptide (TPR) repeat protein
MSARSPSASAAGAVLLAAARFAILGVMAGTAGALAPGGGGIAAPSYAAADPFYLDLLRDGMQSYDRGDYAAAAKRLRLACFGMLDEPQQLAACLTRLGLAEAAAGNTDAFRETFRRIVEVEDRFGAYNRADLPPEVRAAFEQRALAAVPAGTLETIPAFRALLGRKLEAQVAALPPRERRRQLEERLVKEPRNVFWNVLLAELDLAEGKTAPAVTRAEATAALAPRDPRALCVRGLARAAAKRCSEAIGDLESCPAPAAAAGATGPAAGGPGGPGGVGGAGGGESAGGQRNATVLLACRVELGQWRQAEEQVRALPAAWKQDREIAALVRQVAKHPSVAGAPPGGKSAGPAAAAAAPVPPAAGSRDPGATATKGQAPAAAVPAPAGAARPTAAGAAGPTAGATTPQAGASGKAPATGTSPPAGQSTSPAAAGDPKAAPASPAAAAAPVVPRPLVPLSAAEREAMARSEKLLTATAIPDLREALRLARQLADAHPDSKEAQYLAGEAAYRNSRWSEAAAYFRRGGPPGDDHPELLFYMAVAFYEVGDKPAAASALKRSLPNLQKTPFVESYVKRILGQ